MPDLFPLSFASLTGRLKREMDRLKKDPEDPTCALYSLARRDFWTPKARLDLSFQHPAGRAANPVGPASGPHTQMAQNIVLSFLAGARFMELKTVQILDTLEIPRPCIHVPHIGYNVEWSQELLVEQSAREYVSAWFLLHMLTSEHGLRDWDGGAADTIFDLSVGYDLAGIQSPKVDAFIRTLKDASPMIAELRDEIRSAFPELAAVDVPNQISSSVTLSTFHGCPAEEIEGIASHTLENCGLHTVIKLNPTLLGHAYVRKTLDHLGYDHITLDESAFEKDLQWDQLAEMLPRLRQKADALGLGFGVKFSNTLVCQSDEPPFGEGEMYLSGPPLHVLALELAERVRGLTGGVGVHSFSAGIDQMNFADVVAGGLAPVTTCSDLLKGTGYARLPRYLRNLEKKMEALGATTLEEFQAKEAERVAGAPADDPKGVCLADRNRRNVDDIRYKRLKNQKPPKKIGSKLELLDCITCDKCIKVCPNMANITVEIPQGEWSPGNVKWADDEREMGEGETVVAAQAHQIGNVVDLCNLCGQCDPWCPEDGGPYIEKPHLFLTDDAWTHNHALDGFRLVDGGVEWRRGGEVLRYIPQSEGKARVEVSGGHLIVDAEDAVLESGGKGEIDLSLVTTMRLFLGGFRSTTRELFVEL